ncbi:hypothetical protein ACXR6G_07345 [Ancylomarina sp. YFZ004]
MKPILFTLILKELTFEIEATDEDGPIGSSLHKRYVIDPIKFMARA